MFEFKESKPIFEFKESKPIKEGEGIIKETMALGSATEEYKYKLNRPGYFDIIRDYLDQFDERTRSILKLFIDEEGGKRRNVWFIKSTDGHMVSKALKEFWQKNEEAKIERQKAGEKTRRQQAEALLRKQEKRHKKAYSKYEKL